jgi:hypothetical protein
LRDRTLRPRAGLGTIRKSPFSFRRSRHEAITIRLPLMRMGAEPRDDRHSGDLGSTFVGALGDCDVCAMASTGSFRAAGATAGSPCAGESETVPMFQSIDSTMLSPEVDWARLEPIVARFEAACRRRPWPVQPRDPPHATLIPRPVGPQGRARRRDRAHPSVASSPAPASVPVAVRTAAHRPEFM